MQVITTLSLAVFLAALHVAPAGAQVNSSESSAGTAAIAKSWPIPGGGWIGYRGDGSGVYPDADPPTAVSWG